jgi:hypothetical protein
LEIVIVDISGSDAVSTIWRSTVNIMPYNDQEPCYNLGNQFRDIGVVIELESEIAIF